LDFFIFSCKILDNRIFLWQIGGQMRFLCGELLDNHAFFVAIFWTDAFFMWRTFGQPRLFCGKFLDNFDFYAASFWLNFYLSERVLLIFNLARHGFCRTNPACQGKFP
jgi:hypothetical protein